MAASLVDFQRDPHALGVCLGGVALVVIALIMALRGSKGGK